VDKVSLRFQGRFLYAEDRSKKTLSVVAPRFAPEPFGEHRPLMSIRHASVLFKVGADGEKRQVTTLNPAFRILSESTDADPQVLVWDLTGLKVKYVTSSAANGGLTTTTVGGKTIEVVGLDRLEDNETRRATRKDDLIPGTDWANAVVQVTDMGAATAVEPIPYSYSHESIVRAGQPPKAVKDRNNPNKDLIKHPAERVDFDITIPEPGDDAHLTLMFEKRGSPIGEVCVKKGGIVCFSNACAEIHEPPQVDLEFSRYYDMLQMHHKDALIPFDDSLVTLIEGIPCYQQSQVPF
jgi:hypothetical protein